MTPKVDYFTCTSDAEYDRHTYRINQIGGQCVDIDTWEGTFRYWIEHRQLGTLVSIDVIDTIKQTKRPKPKGF